MKTKRWDAADHLDSEAAVEAYLEAAVEDGDPALVVAVRNDIAVEKVARAIAREMANQNYLLFTRLQHTIDATALARAAIAAMRKPPEARKEP